MAERTTLARPYAEAVFRLASEASSQQRWGDVLGFYAIAVADKNLAFALGDPGMTGEQIDVLLASLLEDISGQEQALISMLRENGKLLLLPEISTLFNELRASSDGTIDASVVSAFALDEVQISKLAKMLKKELDRDVNIKASVDPSIIGGVIIRAGDTVIDGSVAGSLRDLTSYLTH
ncbi:MAG: F0F1 ATP synthase subunit delta [Gammaproteobacteria bacterium]|nr:MAG: F0F1 ATP synthase subunit delta [Gammaproteobacteria bacterium]